MIIHGVSVLEDDRIKELENRGYEFHSYHSVFFDEAKDELLKIREGGEYFACMLQVLSRRKKIGIITVYYIYKKQKRMLPK